MSEYEEFQEFREEIEAALECLVLVNCLGKEEVLDVHGSGTEH